MGYRLTAYILAATAAVLVVTNLALARADGRWIRQLQAELSEARAIRRDAQGWAEACADQRDLALKEIDRLSTRLEREQAESPPVVRVPAARRPVPVFARGRRIGR